MGTHPVPPDTADLLGVAAGTPVVARRRLNGDPQIEMHRQPTGRWLHPSVVEALPVLAGRTGVGGIYDRIEEWAGQPLSWEKEITAASASPVEPATDDFSTS